MKTYKSIDFFLQIILLIIIVLTIVIGNHETLNPFLFILLFAGVQIISLLANAVVGVQSWKKSAWRKYHLIGTGIVLALLVVALLQDSSRSIGDKDDKYGMPGLATMVYATIPAILLSLFYVVITWQEWKRLKVRNDII